MSKSQTHQSRCCTCSYDASVCNMMDETAIWSYLYHLLSLRPHQDNELLVYHMCEMHQRNVTLCVCLSVCVCVWERPCVLTLPIVFTATRLSICSEVQPVVCVLLRAVAAIGFAAFPPSLSPASPQCLVCAVIQGLFSFWWGVT